MSDTKDKKKSKVVWWIWLAVAMVFIAIWSVFHIASHKVVKPEEAVLAEYTKPGAWSQYYVLGQLRDISPAPDREWQITRYSRETGKNVEGFIEPIPPGIIYEPYDLVKVRIRSPKESLRIQYVAKPSPRP